MLRSCCYGPSATSTQARTPCSWLRARWHVRPIAAHALVVSASSSGAASGRGRGRSSSSSSSRGGRGGRSTGGRGGRGRDSGGGPRGRGSPSGRPAELTNTSSQVQSSSLVRPSRPSRAPPSDDFVVIGKSEQPLQLSAEELEARKGAALGEDELHGGEEEEGGEQYLEADEEGGAWDDEDLFEMAQEGELGPRVSADLARTIRSGGAADDAELQELMSALQELAPELAEEGETPEAAAWREVYTSRQLPKPQTGPVAVKAVAGKGRGMVTTGAVTAGELLLVAAPLGILYCEEGTTPENEDLADLMAGTMKFTAQQLAAFKQLRPAEEGQGPVQQLPDPEMLTGQDAGWSEGPSSSLEVPQPQLYALVNANCTGEEFEDPVLSALRGTRSCGHVGLWPAVAMINHSCCPSAVAYTIGDRMVVRSSQELLQGGEVSLSYLGSLLTAPLAARQQELRTQYKFDCGCARCKAEAQLPQQLRTTMDDIHAACEELSQQVEEAVDADDVQQLTGIYQRLLDMQADFEGQLKAAKPNVKTKRWAQASVYDLYDLLSLCLDQQLPGMARTSGSSNKGRGGKQGRQQLQIETESLAVCSRLVGSVAGASSAHLDLVTEYMVRAEAKFGLEHQEADDAAKSCAAATAARYGPVSETLLQLFMDTRVGLGTEEADGAEDEEEEEDEEE